LETLCVSLIKLGTPGRFPVIMQRRDSPDGRDTLPSRTPIADAGRRGGVGKTAVNRDLPQDRARPERPQRLGNAHVVQLQMSGLSPTMLRGCSKSNTGDHCEVKERDNLILFIDEAHTIIGAGPLWAS
jgi:hypothetical protein